MQMHARLAMGSKRDTNATLFPWNQKVEQQYSVSNKGKHNDSMSSYTDSDVSNKDGGDKEPSEMSNTSSITDDGIGHFEESSSVEEINDTMASVTMEASTSNNELNCVKHLDKEVQVTYNTTFVNALLVHIDDLENSNITKVSI